MENNKPKHTQLVLLNIPYQLLLVPVSPRPPAYRNVFPECLCSGAGVIWPGFSLALGSVVRPNHAILCLVDRPADVAHHLSEGLVIE